MQLQRLTLLWISILETVLQHYFILRSRIPSSPELNEMNLREFKAGDEHVVLSSISQADTYDTGIMERGAERLKKD